MPLVKHLKNADGSEYAIWHITEDEQFFQKILNIECDNKREHRRLEFLASRYLLQYLIKNTQWDQLKISASGKPYFTDKKEEFSISHSYPFVAVAIHPKRSIGIDIQLIQDRISTLQYKFLSREEMLICEEDIRKITLAWTAKEAVYKWYAAGTLDFIQHMPIQQLSIHNDVANIEMLFSKNEKPTTIYLSGGLEKDFAWAMTESLI